VRQKAFSDAVRQNYDFQCAFPECGVDEAGFLIGTHIARWTEDEDFRHSVDNGFSFCLMHRRAFELGLFTVDARGAIYSRQDRWEQSSWASERVAPHVGKSIRAASTPPAVGALRRHWERIDLFPEDASEAPRQSA
jgi:hypothetical protein